MADGFDVEDFLDSYEGQVATVAICARGDLVAEHAALERSIMDRGPSDTLHDADLAALRDQLRAIEADMAAATREFTFAAMPTRAWQDLIRKHPPTKAQKAQHGAGLDHNTDTFPVAAVAASAVSPELTDEQAQRLFERLPFGEWSRLWDTARTVNMGAVTAPKSVAVGLIDAALANAASSTTARPGASPEASS